jgi:DNA-binding MarR family transcriptional regulator
VPRPKARASSDTARVVLRAPPSILKSSLFLTIQVLREAARVRDREFPDARLRFPHRGVLACLQEGDGLSQREVADRLRIDPSDLVKVLDDLEGWSMVTRRRDKSDRRRQLLELTAEGRKAAREHDEVVAEAESWFLRPLTKPERKQFRSMLERIFADLVARGGDKKGPPLT